MNDLVSILIPAYNAEKWIRDSMLSATNQTWANKEIIVVDDGSSDRTYDIAKSLESRTVKVVTQTNTGACAARNKALSLAQGDYIQWLDADDLLHPEKIALQLKRGGDGQNSRVLLTSAWGKFFFRHEKAKFIPDSLWQDLGPVDWIVTKFCENVWMNPAVWLVSRRLTELAGPWDQRLAGAQDGEYICRVVAASEGVRFVQEAQCYYRIGIVGSVNWNKEKSKKILESLFLSLSLDIDHLRSLEDSEKTRKASLQYLQTWLPYFYSANEDFFDRIYNLAHELGGNLTPPKVSWKYLPLEKTFGPEVTRKVMNHWRAAKLVTQMNWDKCLYHLTR